MDKEIPRKADTLIWSREACEKAKEPKALRVIDAATRIDAYDGARVMTQVVAMQVDFFGRHPADTRGAK